eukprot:475467_1
MTVGFAGVLLSAGDFKEDQENTIIMYLYIAFQYSVAIFSLLGVVVGTFKYSYFNNIPHQMMDKAVAASKHVNLVYYIYAAIVSQCVASMFGTYLLLGVTSMIIVMFLLLLFICLGVWTAWSQKRSYEGIGLFVIRNN